MRALGLSARGYARVLKVVRTIADLADERNIGITHIAESSSIESSRVIWADGRPWFPGAA